MVRGEIVEHPDITAALRTGYASYQNEENQDTPESREEFIEDHTNELLAWIRATLPEVLEEFIEKHETQYKNWLN